MTFEPAHTFRDFLDAGEHSAIHVHQVDDLAARCSVLAHLLVDHLRHRADVAPPAIVRAALGRVVLPAGFYRRGLDLSEEL